MKSAVNIVVAALHILPLETKQVAFARPIIENLQQLLTFIKIPCTNPVGRI
jgi:hypothetical protein